MANRTNHRPAYPPEVRQEAVAYYEECRDYDAVVRKYGMSRQTLENWVRAARQSDNQVDGESAQEEPAVVIRDRGPLVIAMLKAQIESLKRRNRALEQLLQTYMEKDE